MYMKIKTFLLLIGIVLSPIVVVAQNNIIIQQSTNNSSTQYQKADHSFYIQGISSVENIGGVDVEIKRNPDPYSNPYMKTVYFTNYRDFPVTVLFQFTKWHPDSSNYPEYLEGSITLKANETKQWGGRINYPHNFKLIVRRL